MSGRAVVCTVNVSMDLRYRDALHRASWASHLVPLKDPRCENLGLEGGCDTLGDSFACLGQQATHVRSRVERHCRDASVDGVVHCILEARAAGDCDVGGLANRRSCAIAQSLLVRNSQTAPGFDSESG